ncbi:ATP-binding cassette domain-containing protein [Rosenbergiella sp. S61]|uniref:ATP-binding cassette domain-containing protein n=1 Tax=Rosenbergiella gaditana TaxID=2726987 RepID=A0ABS5SSY6_9GAMM|nr:ATP-binding cassette domain-containing protein [Rosenbergiella gaditana]MBT0723121.1 ATP-binding cassette domain-containing protein [Rosenbergiella gaditana]
MIHFTKLYAGYSGQRITPAIDGSLPVGSLTALTGDNGCGKSTLLKTLAGLLPVCAGHYHCDSTNIALLPQHQSLDRTFPLSVKDIVNMGGWSQRTWSGRLQLKVKIRIQEAMDLTGISELANTPLAYLSGGQLQRALFARMWVQDSDVWLLDEPFTGVDESTITRLMTLVGQASEQGKTIVMVLHDEQLVRRYFTRQLVLTPQSAQWVIPIDHIPSPCRVS